MAGKGAQGRERGKEAETEKRQPEIAEPVVPIPAIKLVPSVLKRIEVVPVPRGMWGKQPKEEGHGQDDFEFTHERFSASRDGVAATTGFLFPANYQDRQEYGMEYKLKDENMRFTYFTTGEPGEVRAVIPGEEHTVVITTTQAMLVTGWAAWQRGERNVVIDGRPQPEMRVIFFGLPEQFAGDGLLSTGASYSNGMTTIFTINKEGLLGARGVSLASILYADMQFEPSEGWQLLSAGDVVLLVREGSANAYVLSADFSGEPKINMHTLILPEAVRGRAELFRGEGGYTIVYDGGEAAISAADLVPRQAQK